MQSWGILIKHNRRGSSAHTATTTSTSSGSLAGPGRSDGEVKVWCVEVTVRVAIDGQLADAAAQEVHKDRRVPRLCSLKVAHSNVQMVKVLPRGQHTDCERHTRHEGSTTRRGGTGSLLALAGTLATMLQRVT